MTDYKHVQLSSAAGPNGPVTIARLVDAQLIKRDAVFTLRDELLRLVDEGHKRLVIDFAVVESFSTETLNTLIMLDDKLNKAGGQQRLCNIRPLVQSVFEITRLSTKFTILPTEADALAGF